MRNCAVRNVIRLVQHSRRYTTQSGNTGQKSGGSTTSSAFNVKANVPGLSSNVVTVPNFEVGPGASKSGQYKNPEYFCYNVTSYFDAEIEMLKYRLPQPSALKK